MKIKPVFLLCGILHFLFQGLPVRAGVTPLRNAHAHNDYEHPRPLADALDNGFCSIEPDIYLVDGQLLVAHDRDKVRPERTLQALYLDPLRERVRKNGGRVYPGGPDVTLLVDVKSDAEQTYMVLREILRQYADILTVFRPSGIQTNAVTVILSGNRPKAMLAAEEVRYAALDGRLEDLEGHAPNRLIPLVSDAWERISTWQGAGPLPEAARQKMKTLAIQAHRQGRRIRFWGTPDQPECWREMQDAGVDLINTDRLSELRDFLLRKQAGKAVGDP